MNLRALNLNLLVVLQALLEERNVTRAARRLGLTQPAVSNALAQLRGWLDDPLLVRTPRGMVPTERALSLAGPINAALATIAGALTPEPPFRPADTHRTFVITATDLVEFVLLPKLLGRMAIEAPNAKLHVRSWPHHRVPPTLETGESDLMIGFYPEPLPPGHHHTHLFDGQFVCIVRKDHPQVRRKLTLERYVQLGHVLVTSETASPGVVDVALAAQGLQRRITLRISHFLVVPRIVATSDLIAAIDRRVARTFAQSLPLRLLPPPLPLPSGTTGLVWHERTHKSPAHLWLRKLISEVSRHV